MRVLVVGTLPPPGGARARALAAVVVERTARGDAVAVLSPDPRSAAHFHGRLDRLGLALRLAWLSRRFDALDLHFEAGLPLRDEEQRAWRALSLGGLGLACRLYREVTLRCDSPIPIPGGVGGRATQELWRRATTIVVENDEDRGRMLTAPGVDAARVIVVPRAAPAPASRTDRPWPAATADDLRTEVLGRVRTRAGAARRAHAARRQLGDRAAGRLDDDAFAGEPVAPRADVAGRAAGIALAIVRRLR